MQNALPLIHHGGTENTEGARRAGRDESARDVRYVNPISFGVLFTKNDVSRSRMSFVFFLFFVPLASLARGRLFVVNEHRSLSIRPITADSP
jgi:hypothetical protein